jgi:hypothetical protein
MTSFSDLKSLYEYLENSALDHKYPHQIGELFREVRDLLLKEKKPDEAKEAQWEIDFFSFRIERGKLNPMVSGTGEKGDVVEYPNLNRFDNATYDYLIERLNSTRNALLTARYSHLLWFSPMKHAKFAKTAVESYLRLVEAYEAKDESQPNEHWGLSVLHAIENAYFVSLQADLEIDEVKSDMQRLVHSFNPKSSSSFALRARLIGLMLDERKRFSRKDFVGFEDICWQLSESLAQSNIHGSIDMLELGEKVDQLLEKKTHDWRRRVGESYELLMKQRKPGDLASIYFCQQALETYKKIGDIKKTNELEHEYEKLKSSIKLKELKTEVDLTEHIKRCRQVAEKITEKNPEEIVKILMLERNLLPKYEEMKKLAEEQAKQFPLQGLFPTGIIDQSGHSAQHFSDEEAKKYLGILNQYQLTLELNKMPLVNEILFMAIRKGKLSAEILIKFLNKNSWFGKNLSKKLSTDETIKYNWLNLIAPALHQYFEQIWYSLNSQSPPNLVLCIDSITLKIEGLFRDMCNFSGVTTFYMTQDNKGRNITREKDIHALLYEDQIEKLFDADDLLFFRFLLVEQAGYNLRHRIAHSLMLFQDYSINYMHLLILALLKLGKYDFTTKEQS